jgi:hypothetical protein
MEKADLSVMVKQGVRRLMKMNRLIGIFACLFVLDGVIAFGGAWVDDAGVVDASAADPLNATYIVEGQPIRLIHGRSETASAPGSASKTITSVFGKPIYGNIDGAGNVDAALILTHDPGGSGTFYYAAAALDVNGFYRGTQAILLGDRVVPQPIQVRNGVIVANYATRRLDESMSAAASVGRSKYLVLAGNELTETAPLAEGEVVLDGWVTIGHEVRSFVPCSQTSALWLPGNSPALNQVMSAYGKTLPNPMPYTPLFVTLAGKVVKPPADGFGAGYDASFLVEKLVQVFPQGNCKSDWIYVEFPLPGSLVTSPLKIRGHARGNWFFEGDFPVVLADANGRFIAEWYATAKKNWMTDTFVPFESVITFKPPRSGSKGTLLLQKDNPTDQLEMDDALEIPDFF